jgi:methanogenic corrinoid protein MtbC1
MTIFEKIGEEVIKGNGEAVKKHVQLAIDDGIEANQIINQGLIAGMAIIGERFKKNEVYVPEVLIAARAMKMGMGILQSLLVSGESNDQAGILVGTVKGDLHDVGKNLVIMMLEGAGFKVVDLGVDVPAEKFVSAVKDHQPRVVGLSALLTTTMPEMKNSLEQIKLFDKNIKVVIGGAPVTQEYADSIGADGYAPDAASAIDVVKELLI